MIIGVYVDIYFMDMPMQYMSLCLQQQKITKSSWSNRCDNVHIGAYTLKMKCCNFDEISITGCTGSCEMTIFCAASDENFVKMTMILPHGCQIVIYTNAGAFMYH